MATLAIGPAAILGGTAYWSEQPAVDGGSSPWLLKSTPVQGGPITLIAQLAPEDPAESAIGVTGSAIFLEGPTATRLEEFPIGTGGPLGLMLASGCGNLVSTPMPPYC